MKSSQSDANPKKKVRRIFVVGCPRSGTTLLQSILASHSAALSFPESHFFSLGMVYVPFFGFFVRRKIDTVFANFFEENKLGSADERDEVVCALAARRSPLEKAKWFVAFLDSLAIQAGKSMWIEKTPSHVWFIPLIKKAAPDAFFVHIIRPAGPTVSAWHCMAQKKKRHYPQVLLYVYWHLSLRQTGLLAKTDRNFVIFFDDLISEPEKQAGILFAKLGLDMEEGMWEKRKEIADSLFSQEEKELSVKNNVLKSIGNIAGHAYAFPWYVKLLIAFDHSYERLRRRLPS